MTESNVTDPPVAPAQPVAAPPPEQPLLNSQQLNDRIAQAKRSEREAVLRELGVSSPDEVKAALAAKKAADDANKSAAEKAADLARQLEASTSKAAALELAVKERASLELASLTDAQRAAVQAVAGDDAASQLRAIDKLKPTWAAAPKPLPAPASTSAAPAAPPSKDAPAADVDHSAVYDALKKSNPMMAADYQDRYGAQITADRARKAQPAQ